MNRPHQSEPSPTERELRLQQLSAELDELGERYFDRAGQPITAAEWMRLRQDVQYRQVARTDLAGGGRVITAWLGRDQSDAVERGAADPWLFGTMPFDAQGRAVDRLEVFSTPEEQALQAHAEMVDTRRAG